LFSMCWNHKAALQNHQGSLQILIQAKNMGW
jgi:hypothetical protein